MNDVIKELKVSRKIADVVIGDQTGYMGLAVVYIIPSGEYKPQRKKQYGGIEEVRQNGHFIVF